jgi:hypothetical protein
VQVGATTEQPTHATSITSITVENDVEAAQALRQPVTLKATNAIDEVIRQIDFRYYQALDEWAMSICALALV